MFSVPHDVLRIIQDIAVFGLVLSMWVAMILLWSIKKKKRSDLMQERLKIADPSLGHVEGKVLRLFHEGKEATTVVPGTRGNQGLFNWLEMLRIQANLATPVPAILVNLSIGLLLAALVGFIITSSAVIALAASVAVLVVFWIYLNQRIAKATAKFERQFIDALELATRSLRVGHPLIGSFRLIADEIPSPVGELFAQVCQQQDLGVAMEDALQALARSTFSEDLALFSTSVTIQIRSGGNLADMMQRLAAVIRERQRLARRVRVLTTQTQFSKRVLLAMPFLVFVALSLLNPRYMQVLYTTTVGEIIAVVSAIILLLGWMMMNWLSKLDY